MIFKQDEGWNTIREILYDIVNKIHVEGPVDMNDLETLAFVKRFFPENFKEIENQLILYMGLFYKAEQPQSMRELAYDIFKQIIFSQCNEFFSPIQYDEYLKIRNNDVFTFSAPTSSGKSHLFRYLLKYAEYDILIILPSRALIAEYLYSIKKIVGDEVLVLQFIENVNIINTYRRIFVVTPERAEEVFAQIDSFNIQLILFDEAQIIEEPIRGMRFDALVRKCAQLLPNAKKVFAHPFVNNPEAQLSRNQITGRTHSHVYMQQCVGKIFVLKEDSNFKVFSPFTLQNPLQINDLICETLQQNKTVLIYVSKVSLYSGQFIEDYSKYLDLCEEIQCIDGKNIIKELQDYLGGTFRGEDKSLLLSLMRKGVVIHHGSMPLKARLLVEKFVNRGYAHICFATSTLIQGINMPFDVVWIENFKFNGNEEQKTLELKNLIGRAGRSTNKKGCFDYGYVIINKKNIKTFVKRLHQEVLLNTMSKLDEQVENIDEDLQDVYEAIRDNAYDERLLITDSQKERLLSSDVFDDIRNVLDCLFVEGAIITGDEYYNISAQQRSNLKQSIANIYTKHLRRDMLEDAERAVLSASIPIILWRIQGKSFREIVALRKHFVTNKKEKDKYSRMYKRGVISAEEFKLYASSIRLKYTPIAGTLPNKKMRARGLFNDKFVYDILVYDTYDYIDKVINLSLSTPICAALMLYYESLNDVRALSLVNYIKYGTNDAREILLLRYGFSMDDFPWLLQCIDEIDEQRIKFNEYIITLTGSQYDSIARYVGDPN